MLELGFGFGDDVSMLYPIACLGWNDSFVTNLFIHFSYLMQGYLYISYSLITLIIYNF